MNTMTTLLDGNTKLIEKPIFRNLTIRDLRKATNKRIFYVKKGYATIFPMDVGYGIVLSGYYDGKNIPVVNELKIAQILKELGNTGWTECKVSQN